MRKISCGLPATLIAGSLLPAAMAGQQVSSGTEVQPIIIPSQSSVYNQNSVTLPNPPTVHGQDVVRGAGGVSCQSAVASSGPYVDVGMIGSEDVFDRSTGALYGRIVFPLGKKRRRIDCNRLYELEIERMRLELELLRMGTGLMADPMPPADLLSAASFEHAPENAAPRDGDKEGGPVTVRQDGASSPSHTGPNGTSSPTGEPSPRPASPPQTPDAMGALIERSLEP